MATWIESIDSVPDVILCSSAARTMQTAQLMLPVWGTRPKLVTSEGLYLSGPETIFRLIDEELTSVSRLLVIAHNPGISSITSHLAKQLVQMPTAAAAAFTHDAADEMDAAGNRQWQFQSFMCPKALPAPGDTASSDTATGDTETDPHSL